MVRRGKPAARGRAPRRPQYDEESEEEQQVRMPKFLDDSDEDQGIDGEDEEIDSDEAFGEDEEDLAIEKDTARGDTPDDFEDDEGDDLVALSNLLDGGEEVHYPSDSDEDEEYDDEDLDEDLAELVAQRTKRAADDAEALPQKRSRKAERNEVLPEGSDAAGGPAKLRLEDLVSNLGQDTRVSSEVRALQQANSRGQPVASKRGGGALHAPLPGIQQDRLDRQAAYALSREEAQGWAPTIKRLREAEHLSFPLQKPAQPPAPSNAGLTASFTPSTDMEKDVAALLASGGLTEKQIAEQEGLAMKNMDPAEVQARQAELRRMRELMFRMEQKARRANKIKSKTYRRVHRRERERLAQQMAAAQDLEDDDEGEDEASLKAAQERAKERATLRHKNTGKWAKSHLGRNDDASQEARLAIEEQLQRGDALRRRIHVDDSDEDEDDFEDTNASRDAAFDELEEYAQRERARDAQTEAEMERAGKPGKNVFQMKFMKDARDRQRREADESINELRSAIAEEDDEEDDEAIQRVGRSGRAVYGSGAISSDAVPTRPAASHDAPTRTASQSAARGAGDAPERAALPSSSEANPWLTGEASSALSKKQNSVLVGKDSGAATRAAHRQSRHAARGAEARDAAADDATLDIDPSTHMERAEESDESASEMVEVTKHSRGKRGRGKRASTLMPMQQRDLVAEAFAGDDVTLDFARDKQRAIRQDAPREESTELPGWGAWGGKGARRKPKKHEHVRKLPGLDPTQRKDRAMDNVIINERLDKKAAKYKAKDLPFPYTSASQYEAAMRQPIGSEWNTRTQHQRLTLPRVTTKMGQRIDPIQRKF